MLLLEGKTKHDHSTQIAGRYTITLRKYETKLEIQSRNVCNRIECKYAVLHAWKRQRYTLFNVICYSNVAKMMKKTGWTLQKNVKHIMVIAQWIVGKCTVILPRCETKLEIRCKNSFNTIECKYASFHRSKDNLMPFKCCQRHYS